MNKLNQLKHKLLSVKTHWNTPPEGRDVPYKEMAAFTLGGVGNGFLINLMYTFLTAALIPYMYNIDTIHGTNIMFANTVLNLLVQPVFAKLFDKPRNGKWGKFKVYFTLLAPLFSFFLLLACWSPKVDSESFRIVFAYVTCIPTLILGNLWYFTFVNFPNVMTKNSQERTDMLAPINLIWSFAPTVLNLVVGPLRDHFIEKDKEYIAFRLLSILFVIVGLILSILIIRYANERVVETKESKEEIPLSQGIKMVLKNKPFLARQFAQIFNVLRVFFTTQLWFIAAFKYADTYGPGLTTFSMLSLITGFGATPGMILAPLLTRKMSKRNILILSNLFTVVPFALILLFGGFGNMVPGSMSTIVIMTVTGFLFSFTTGLIIVIGPAIDGDLYDYQQYISGHRLEGTMFLVASWTASLFGQLTSYIPTFIQRAIGFQQGEARFQSDAAFLPENMAIIDRWFNAVAIITVVGGLLYMLFYLFYKLDEKKHAEIIVELEKRAAQDALDDNSVLQANAGVEETGADNEILVTEEVTIQEDTEEESEAIKTE